MSTIFLIDDLAIQVALVVGVPDDCCGKNLQLMQVDLKEAKSE
ncbi:MAG: hypothetical protein U5M23_13240 [Marinagarivorans sp.]|nr:hypothetical protein [Marinagarivorans sp.]